MSGVQRLRSLLEGGVDELGRGRGGKRGTILKCPGKINCTKSGHAAGDGPMTSSKTFGSSG